jgi:hypothetical protein
MKTLISTLALVACFGFVGSALAQDAMAPAADAMAPMAADAMAPMAADAMAPMSGDMMSTMMTPNQMLEACLKNAGMLADAMAQDAGKKTCNDAIALAMGTPMAGDAMAPMGGDAMAADPAAKPAM